MTKTKLVFIAMALALVTWVGASAVSAQDGPSITLDPASVTEAGEVEVTVTGSGWTVAAVNVLTCNIAADANAAELDSNENCTLASGNLNLASMVSGVSVSDGGFEATITVDVPAQGIFVAAGDSGQQEGASALLAVAAADDDMADDDMADDMADDDMADDDMADDDMADDMADDDMADDADDDMADDDMADDDMADDADDDMADDMADDDADDDMADDMADDDMLADTGSNTPLLAIVALAVVLAGAMVLGLGRRLRTQ